MYLHQLLVDTYVNGWHENNIDQILATLSNDCVVIESHGTTYRGKKQVQHWFEEWLKQNGRVLKWDILSFYETSPGSAVFFEWDFTCKVMGKTHHLPGVSLVRFRGNKINFIHEYRMTRQAYDFEPTDITPMK